MNCITIGKLIRDLRIENSMTQKQLADAMNISDKTISKWERGRGCPDVSLLSALSNTLGVNIQSILSGALDVDKMNGGNMNRIKFYRCDTCDQIMTVTGEPEISCCGRKLQPMQAKPAEEEHSFTIEEIEDNYYITFNHDMSKAHYIHFVACVCCDRVLWIKLYPEQSPDVRFPKMRGETLYFACNAHGLWRKEL